MNRILFALALLSASVPAAHGYYVTIFKSYDPTTFGSFSNPLPRVYLDTLAFNDWRPGGLTNFAFDLEGDYYVPKGGWYIGGVRGEDGIFQLNGIGMSYGLPSTGGVPATGFSRYCEQSLNAGPGHFHLLYQPNELIGPGVHGPTIAVTEFHEWRNGSPEMIFYVPDPGATLGLVAFGLLCMTLLRRGISDGVGALYVSRRPGE